MANPLKLIAAAAIAAAPIPALAQPATATPERETAAPAVENAKEAPKAQPVALADKTALHHAVFHPRAIPTLPKVQRTAETEADAPELEVLEKDFRADKQGFRIAAAKIEFSHRF